MKTEYSRYYCLNSQGSEIFTDTTTLNRKGDGFHHSVFIKSSFFDDFVPGESSNDVQGSLELTGSRKSPAFKFLMSQLDKFLRDKRQPFLKAYSEKLIEEFEEEEVFPKYNTQNAWDEFRKNELYELVKELYQVEPKLFTSLNLEQKKTFVRFLDLIMDSGERERLFEVLEGIIDLNTSEREELSRLLKTSSLSRIINTIKLIEDRYKAVLELKELIFNKELKANERDHIQKYVEKHYWIFGEQYHLVTAAEPDFEEALRRYVRFLRDEVVDGEIDHPDKEKEMDIFAVRQDLSNDTIQNIVIELKSPIVKLGQKQLDQVKKYMNVVLSQDKFNASNMYWTFYLIGNSFDTSKYIENEIQNSKNHGERSLVYKVNNYKIYVKTWSELFADFELRHDYLNKKLQLERQKLSIEGLDADEIVARSGLNSAGQPDEVVISTGTQS